MPFWEKAFSSRTKVYYPRAIVQGKPVETEAIAGHQSVRKPGVSVPY